MKDMWHSGGTPQWVEDGRALRGPIPAHPSRPRSQSVWGPLQTHRFLL